MTAGLSAVINHLWQSTLFALVCVAVAFALRQYAARVRFWIWFAASAKFVLPFAWLTAMGARMAPPRSSGATPAVSVVIDQIGRPFTAAAARAAVSQTDFVLTGVLMAIWLAGTLAVGVTWLMRWRRVQVALSCSTPSSSRDGVAIRTSAAAIEPGVVGVFRPVLLLPEGLPAHLSSKHLDAIIAHELCHVRWHDNLTALAHMVVEALFWFHPLVWWLGGRLVAERERACDEAVVELGNEPEAYAEGILKVCRYSVETGLVCVSGVTGADLKRRIETIMTCNGVVRLANWQRAVLTGAALAAAAAPVLFGMTQAPAAPAQAAVPASTPQAFEVASIKPSAANDPRVQMMITPGRMVAKNMPLNLLIQQAYGVRDFQITGGPKWMDNERFDIEAKIEGQPDKKQLMAMMQALLAERFHAKFHRETKELPVYNLVVAKNGPKLLASPAGQRPGITRMGRGVIGGQGLPVEAIAASLANVIRRSVIDKTGLTGQYDFKLEWTPDADEGSGPRDINPNRADAADSTGVSIFTALQEQAGLKLEPSKGPVEILIIDSIEKPTAN